MSLTSQFEPSRNHARAVSSLVARKYPALSCRLLLVAFVLLLLLTNFPRDLHAQQATDLNPQVEIDPPSGESGHPLPQPFRRIPDRSQSRQLDESTGPQLPLNQRPLEWEQAPDRFVIPPFGRPSDIQIDVKNGRISLVARGAPLRDVLSLLAEKHGMNLVMAQDAIVPITITLNEVTLMDALEALVSVSGYTWTTHRGIVHVSSISSSNSLTPHVQGRVTRIFELDFVSAVDLELAIRGMLSPSGTTQIMLNDPRDNRRTKEVVMVEDFPAFVHRIEQYVAAVDILPRQVLIQVHVLEVDLDEQNRHGVNFESLMRLGGGNIRINTVGLANAVSGQAIFAEINGTDVDSLLEALATHTDSETLASPRVVAMNGQESRLQVGEKLGYRTSTTTETSTLESINFLDVGVVLNVTPRITRDDSVLLHIKPEVSSGEVNEVTGLPNESTSEVETNLVLRSGQGLVIGGLIQERDSFSESKAPFLGDLKLLGNIFRRRVYTTDRSEIIFVLVPHIIPHGCGPEPWQGTGNQVNCSPKLNKIDFQQPMRCDYTQPTDPVYGPPTQTIVVPTSGQEQPVPVRRHWLHRKHGLGKGAAFQQPTATTTSTGSYASPALHRQRSDATRPAVVQTGWQGNRQSGPRRDTVNAPKPTSGWRRSNDPHVRQRIRNQVIRIEGMENHMSEPMDVPPELLHLIEKREQEEDRRQRDSGAQSAADSKTAEELPDDGRETVERRKQARRQSDQDR